MFLYVWAFSFWVSSFCVILLRCITVSLTGVLQRCHKTVLFCRIMIGFILAVILIILIVKFLRKYGFPATSCVTLVTGGVKVGKSSWSVWFCILEHFRRLVGVLIYNFFHSKKKAREIPMLRCKSKNLL